jgi:hypothetical protein
MIKTVKKIYNKKNQFSNYQLIFENSNIEYSVPLSEDNSDYQAIQKWIAEGGEVIDNPPTE